MALELTIKFGFGVGKLNCQVANDIAGKRVRIITRNIDETALELIKTEREMSFVPKVHFPYQKDLSCKGLYHFFFLFN